ncbi:plasmid partitioning protein RepB C-terminal domain-containing protein [Ochrobactrum chromiisoli]|uniref:ParB N-terminal domain-containing protein n=1 Tax=Ochrobactrum chromiisoli TaxID=2993941 RepID=A0ABT3QSL9_9HYPH|nr:plasmid partitioning protein RepB C-terminal domain-containing protein [Ochrobactrum chromiisoli]MCX2698618.1 ParB N-terminal domain-containing protein [Ochrobactrum chromiisoli]
MSNSRKDGPVSLAFETTSLRISLDSILPLRPMTPAALRSSKYAQIAASIAEIGLIEPPVLVRDKQNATQFHLLDGHLRLDVLRKRGDTEVVCLVATEDEAFTYNKRISRLATIQEHKMIMKAIEKGVSEERLARALNVNINSIRAKKRLLDGICPEAAELLKDRHVPLNSMSQIKKLKPMRQIEVAELMIAMNNYSQSYANSLVLSTPESMLIAPKKAAKGLTLEQISRMESETANLEKEFKIAEEDYGKDNIDLVIATGYVGRLLENVRVVRQLAQYYPEILAEFQRISENRKAA